MLSGVIASSKLKIKTIFVVTSTGLIQMGDFAAAQLSKTSVASISCWLKWTETGLCMPVAKCTLSTGWFLRLLNGAVGFMLTSNFSGGDYMAADTPALSLNDGFWHHVVVTLDGTGTVAGMKIYIDGVGMPLTPEHDALSGSTSNSQPLGWGGRNYGSISQLDFMYHGAFADLALYDKKLSPIEVLVLYNGGNPPPLDLVGPTGNLKGYWRPRVTGDVLPNIADVSGQGHAGVQTVGLGQLALGQR